MKIKKYKITNCYFVHQFSKRYLIVFSILFLLFTLQFMLVQSVSGQTEEEDIPQIVKPKVDVTIDGTPADDRIKGGNGNDRINGEEGYDVIFGGPGDDRIEGGQGNDELHGEDGDDDLRGGAGDDRIYGGRGIDEIDGGEGNDELDGGLGKDMLTGSAGADLFKCDQFDEILDFDSSEGDTKVGQCLIGNESLS